MVTIRLPLEEIKDYLDEQFFFNCVSGWGLDKN
jgi:hypothetical protein